MRDHVLGRPPVTQILEDSFISTWSLKAELQVMSNNHSFDEETRRFASIILGGYEFPVTSFVISPNGTIIDKVNANVVLEKEAEWKGDQGYYGTFLKTALDSMEVNQRHSHDDL